ncbi:ABC transporter permease [Halorubellus sp. JP-L1]|uniref:ABC transporter permease n=1 Tax=Halorubellus sp. JP-L1 TaxID=2715753 RepID=UPI001408B6B4|nr:ABC transporter permease [Halorubellus sp. JP-L1]NHN42900.1 ABC transporter permease [Halorubellus sp. JP-L1]
MSGSQGTATVGESIGDSVGSTIDYLKPIVGLVVVWEVIATFELVPSQSLPHTYVVAETLVDLVSTGSLLELAALTAGRAFLAFLIAIVIGVALGLAMAQSTVVGWFFDPIISLGFPIPKVTLVPVYVLWFGFGNVPAVALAVTSAVFPIVIATYDGARGIKRELVWSARSMGVSRVGVAREVVLPAALPSIFNGVQIALFLSFVVVVVAEMVTAGGGLGQMLTESVRFFQTATTIAAVITVAVIGLVSDRLFRLLRGRLLRWTDDA